MGAASENTSADTNPAGQVAVPLLDLQLHHAPLRDEIIAALAAVYDSGQFVLGPDCQRLEEQMAAYCQTRHAIGCASGSDALLLALMAYDVGRDEEVIMPSYTFFATASAAWRLGAKPVFVDILPDTYNIDPSLIEAAITPRTKAILPVHLYGQSARMDSILQVATAHGVPVIEDAAQAVGAELAGKRAGSMGQIGCFSFYPTKNLGACGDAGMLTTNCDELADSLRQLRVHGEQTRYHHDRVGINSRLDSLQAATLNAKMPHLDRWTSMREANAWRYTQLFDSCGLADTIGLPSVAADRRHVWNQYVIRVPGESRDALREFLASHQIGTQVYYPVPLHLQKCFAPLGYSPGDLPVSEQAARETVALPIYPELTAEQQRTAVARVAEFFGHPGPAVPKSPPRPKFLDAIHIRGAGQRK